MSTATPRKIRFTKMHGLGNDFVVIDATSEPLELTPAQAAFIADRHYGVGCDQILLVETSARDGIDFRYRIINADGSEVGQCGNGARCFAHFVHEQGLTDKNPLVVETISSDITLHTDSASAEVTVDMGVPNFEPADIPLLEEQRKDRYAINKDGDAIRFFATSIGNPHAVLLVEDVDHAPITLVGPMLESHPIFPQRTNVGFMQVVDQQQVRLRVFERGAGETLACGSGACAAVVCGINAGLLISPVSVSLPGGTLQINWQGEGEPVLMRGPANVSFNGEIELAI